MFTQQNPQNNLQSNIDNTITITENNFIQVLDAIKNNDPSITSVKLNLNLNLDSSNVDENDEKIKQILIALQQNTTITKLSIACIDNSNIQFLVEALQKNKTLKSLDLSLSQLTHIDLKILFDALNKMKNLTSLDLSDIPLSLDSIEVLCNSFKENDNITHLNLCECSINSEGAKKIAEMLKVNQTLIEFNLDKNPLTSGQNELFGLQKDIAGILAIFESLKINDTLRSLSFIYYNEENIALWTVEDMPIVTKRLSEALSLNTSLIKVHSDLDLIDINVIRDSTLLDSNNKIAIEMALSEIKNQIRLNSQLNELLIESTFITLALINDINQKLKSKSSALCPLPSPTLTELALIQMYDLIQNGIVDKKILESSSMPKELSEILLFFLKGQEDLLSFFSDTFDYNITALVDQINNQVNPGSDTPGMERIDLPQENHFPSQDPNAEPSKKRDRDEEDNGKELPELKKAKIEENVKEKNEVTEKDGKEEIGGHVPPSSTKSSDDPTLTSCELCLFKAIKADGKTFDVSINREMYYSSENKVIK